MASTLKVNTIAHSGGTNAMTIDSSGNVNSHPQRVTIGVTPYAFVGFPGTDSYVAKTANAIVDFSHAFVNDGNHYDTSTYIIYLSSAGLYRVEVSTLSESVDQAQAGFLIEKLAVVQLVLGGFILKTEQHMAI